MFTSRRAAVLGGDAVLPNNYSLEFDGSNDYVSLGTSVDAGTTSTFSVWVKRDDPSSDVTVVLGEGDNASDYLLYLNRNLQIYVRIGSPYYLYDSTAITDALAAIGTDWMHIVVVRETVSGKVYLNGVLKETMVDDGIGGSPSTWSANTTFDTIGAAQNGASFHIGNIDEVAIWNKALSAGDISALYQAKGTSDLKDDRNSASLKGWWRMGDGALDDRNGLIADQTNATLGAELWDSPASTNGDDANWTAYGTNGLETDADAIKITGDGSNEAGASTPLRETKDLNSDLVQYAVYKFSCDAKVNAGKSVIINTSDTSSTTATVTETTFTRKTIYFRATSTNGDVLKMLDMDSGDIIWLDNFSLKAVNGNAGVMVNMAVDDFVGDTP